MGLPRSNPSQVSECWQKKHALEMEPCPVHLVHKAFGVQAGAPSSSLVLARKGADMAPRPQPPPSSSIRGIGGQMINGPAPRSAGRSGSTIIDFRSAGAVGGGDLGVSLGELIGCYDLASASFSRVVLAPTAIFCEAFGDLIGRCGGAPRTHPVSVPIRFLRPRLGNHLRTEDSGLLMCNGRPICAIDCTCVTVTFLETC